MNPGRINDHADRAAYGPASSACRHREACEEAHFLALHGLCRRKASPGPGELLGEDRMAYSGEGHEEVFDPQESYNPVTKAFGRVREDSNFDAKLSRGPSAPLKDPMSFEGKGG